MANRDTKLFVSVSSRPGTLGARVYTHLFRHYDLNAVYLPRVAPSSGEELLAALRCLRVSGCSVSMPLKSAVIPHLDFVAPEALEMQSVNTIVREDERYCGYNTDYLGVIEALQAHQFRSAVIVGNGGVTGAIVRGLRELGVVDIVLHARNRERGQRCAAQHKVTWMDSLATQECELLINATPVAKIADFPASLRNCAALFDLQPAEEDTPLVAAARVAGKTVIPGADMFMGQVRYQFQRYTGILPSRELICRALEPR